MRYKPHIVHFSGHGSTMGEIALPDESDRTQPVPSNTLAQLFSILKDNMRCVLLNACYSEVQARGIAESIDCVVGMSRAILDKAAIDFAAGFYLGLGYGRSVLRTSPPDGCMATARQQADTPCAGPCCPLLASPALPPARGIAKPIS